MTALGPRFLFLQLQLYDYHPYIDASDNIAQEVAQYEVFITMFW